MYDILVIGGGPAGMTAAIYGARAGKKVCVLEREGFGGQIARSPLVENIPGCPSCSGAAFADRLMDQMTSFGVDIEIGEAQEVRYQDDGSIAVVTDFGDCFVSSSLIIAAGAAHRKLECPGADALTGHGLYYCVTCDGEFARGKTAVMLGGGNSAVVESLTLADMCPELTILYAEDGLFPLAEAASRRAILAKDNVHVMPKSTIVGLEEKDGRLSAVVVDDFDMVQRKVLGNERTISCEALFVSIGLVPQNQVFADVVDLDERGYIVADESCTTRQPNIFVAGDCRRKAVRQVTTACADGTVAALAACRYLDTLASE